MKEITAIYKINDDIINTINVEESDLSMACAYGKELSNRHNKIVVMTLIEQSVVSYSYKPSVNRNNGSYIPPKTDDSPSVIECLNRGS